ncbi:glycoside hydrolase family 3 N-terminal domain-containing protein [Formosa sp. PL04]|uniref:glycoside hydrolase family 3 N-terminal domain-containing protein n=1 Tax=Formosa sp. PL04 TaxID=3081755 RepID=UPI002982165C|nr:glycoside hydrolase family 3 N-terminal domain-containing protein [Formosa sp. PL04]MDW5288121.1 glycoside hydrolase family 3 N-terminal domain-containing protein [Formosa sp. PL04]
MKKKYLYIFIGLAFSSVLFTSCKKQNSFDDKQPNKDQAIYKDPNADINDRVNDLLSKMTLEEKTMQLNSASIRKSAAVEEGVEPIESSIEEQIKNGIGFIENTFDQRMPDQSVDMVNSLQHYLKDKTRLGIPAIIGTECLHGHAGRNSTVFPTPLAMASSWNTELVNEVFDVIGRESRARGGHEAHTPVLDIGRDPRWGRIEETYGEDTYLTTQMGLSIISGLQGGTSGNPGLTHVIASPKHFAGYGQVEGGRNFAATPIESKVLFDEILPPFKAVVEQTNALGMMASHCEVDGVPAHGNKWLLTDLLRETWGFNGIVVSDYNDIKRLEEFHHIAATTQDAAKLGLIAGMDIDLPSSSAFKYLKEVVEENPELEKQLDASVKRILRLKFMLGLFENPFTETKGVSDFIGNEKHVALAEKMATESIVLLKNANNLLPLNLKAIKNIAVIGPNAKSDEMGTYSMINDDVVNILKGITNYVGKSAKVNYAEGGKIAKFESINGQDALIEYTEAEEKESINKAIDLVKESDVAIVCVGGNEKTSREAFYRPGIAGDRSSIDLLSNQNKLVMDAIATGKPVIVVLMGGRPYAIPEIAEKASTIVNTFYLGQTNGDALAKVIFGDVNPSGKLTVSMLHSAGQIPFYYSMKANSFYKGYWETPPTPVYAFGHGLSYTSFEYSDLNIEKEIFGINEAVTFSVKVKNTGKIDGAEVTQIYFRDKVASVTRPAQLLVRFEKVWLKAGEEKTLTFTLNPEKDLSFTGIDLKKVVEPGDFNLMVGAASDDIRLEQTFSLK